MNLRALMPFGSSNDGTRTQPPPNLFGSLHREVDRLFEDFTRNASGTFGQAQVNLVPSIDVSETDKEIVITAEMPGLERKDIDISLEDDVLTIRGEKKIEKQQGDEKNSNYLVAERGYGVFLRRIQLPSGIDPSSIQATMSEAGESRTKKDRGQGRRVTLRLMATCSRYPPRWSPQVPCAPKHRSGNTEPGRSTAAI